MATLLLQALMFVRNPLSGKWRFTMRTSNNFIIIVGVFIVFALLSARFSTGLVPWITDIIAAGILFYLYRIFLNKRAIKIACPHCFEFIRSNVPWTCGFCHKKNTRTDEFPFVNRCEHEDCGAEPRAYKCHHDGCGELIFLTEDHLKDNYACCANAPVEDKAKKEVAFQEQEKKAKEHEITMVELNTRLDEKLKASKMQREFSKEKSPREAAKAKFEKEFADIMAAEEFADEQEAFYEEKYKNNPEKLKRVKEWIADWRGRHT